MRRLALLAVLVLTLIGVESAQAWPQRFTMKEITRDELARARGSRAWDCDESSCIISYSSKCRWFTHGRIECYWSFVAKSLKDDELGYEYHERIYFTLWFPPNRHSRNLPHRGRNETEIDLGGARCAPREEPYLCNGPWVFKHKPHRPWSGLPGGCIAGCGPNYKS